MGAVLKGYEGFQSDLQTPFIREPPTARVPKCYLFPPTPNSDSTSPTLRSGYHKQSKKRLSIDFEEEIERGRLEMLKKRISREQKEKERTMSLVIDGEVINVLVRGETVGDCWEDQPEESEEQLEGGNQDWFSHNNEFSATLGVSVIPVTIPETTTIDWNSWNFGDASFSLHEKSPPSTSSLPYFQTHHHNASIVDLVEETEKMIRDVYGEEDLGAFGAGTGLGLDFGELEMEGQIGLAV
jgi:hypothetical protein